MKKFLVTLVISALLGGNAMAMSEDEAKNVIFGFGKENTAYAKYFIGKSYLNPITTENGVPMYLLSL